MLENMGFRVVDERTYQIAPAGRRAASGSTTCCSSAATAAPIDLDERQGAAGSRLPGGDARRRRERRLQRAGAGRRADVARRRADPHHRRASCARSACRIRRTTCGRRWRKHAAHRGRDRRAVPRPLRSGRGRTAREAREKDIAARIESDAGEGREPRRGPHPAAASSMPCSRRCAPISTSSTQDGQPKPLIAIKFDSRKLDDLPLPRPLYEIFVYSPRVEGVHLRFGKVARGGIRWSDRPQDFRTEVLGLVKAQQVKNAVIVPVGAKGGFVPKLLPKGATPRRSPGRGHRGLQAVHLDAARHHRQSRRRTARSCRRTTSCATTATIPISWSPPTRAPRPSPTSPTEFRSSTASGSATPSPPAARPATTTRRWASPRAAPGRR